MARQMAGSVQNASIRNNHDSNTQKASVGTVAQREGGQTRKRKYTGPPKGSDAAKIRMAQVRAAQWAKNGLVFRQKE
eukprot:1015186-Pleurochrysis_carterae.AAC.1